MIKFIIAAVLFPALFSCGKPGYVIKGDIVDLDEGEINLLDIYGKTISSTEVVDGKFEFKGRVDTACLAYINNALGVVYPIDIPVLLENTLIRVEGDARIGHIEIKGTKANEDMVTFKQEKDKIAPDDTEGYLRLVKETFEENSDNVLASLLISNLYGLVSDEELVAYCDRLAPEFRDSPVVSHYRTISMARIGTVPGKPFVDFGMPDADGNIVMLSDIVSSHKATALVFWASWARDARSLVPEFASLCRKYEDKGLVMYNVSFDSDPVQSGITASEMGLPGLCLCNGPEEGDKAASLYGFEGLPRIVIIGNDGIIVAKGRKADDVAASLDSLFR